MQTSANTRALALCLALLLLFLSVLPSAPADAERDLPEQTHAFDGFGILSVQTGPALEVWDMDSDGLTVTDLVYRILSDVSGVQIRHASFTGDLRAAGIFSGGEPIIGIEEGVVLSTGQAKHVIGPNSPGVRSSSFSRAGDADLDKLVNYEHPTFDAAVLTFEFMTSQDSITFQYLLASDEYPQHYQHYHDVMGIFLDGSNIAWIPETDPPEPLTIGTIFSDAALNRYTDNTDNSYNFGMNGFSNVYSATSGVTPGEWHHLKIAIADFRDYIVDSSIFIKAGSLADKEPEYGVLALGELSYSFNPDGSKNVDVEVVRRDGFDSTVHARLAVASDSGVLHSSTVSFNPEQSSRTMTVNVPASVDAVHITLSAPDSGTGGAVIDPENASKPLQLIGLTIVGEDGRTTIAEAGGTLALSAFTSSGSTPASVVWSVYGQDGEATELAQISSSGVLQALKNGAVQVTAVTQDGSLRGSLDVQLTHQPAQLTVQLELHASEQTGAGLTGIPLLLIQPETAITAFGLTDESGLAVFDSVQAGMTLIQVFSLSAAGFVNSPPLRLEVGIEDNELEGTLKLVRLDRNQDGVFDLADIVLFASGSEAAAGLWDFDGDGAWTPNDLISLMQVLPRAYPGQIKATLPQ